MRLWGRVATVLLLVMAAVFLVVAFVMPDNRWQAFLTAIVALVVALYGVPVLVRWFSSLTGDEEVLSNGIPGYATITSLDPTRWHFNDYPVFRFSLSVEAGGAAYSVEVRQLVDPELLDRLAPGQIVGIRVDRENHKKVVIDWNEPVRGSDEAAGVGPAEQQTTASHSSTLGVREAPWCPFYAGAFSSSVYFFSALAVKKAITKRAGQGFKELS